MRSRLIISLLLIAFSISLSAAEKPSGEIRLLVITGGHDYQKDKFNEMFRSLGENITYSIAELPAAYSMFLPENRSSYDVLVFYHMWQSITPEQAEVFAACIREGKPLVALHHSICAYDEWPEYCRIIGGRYFHKPTAIDGKEYPASSYQHDMRFTVKIADKNHPVTYGMSDFEVFDETYKGYYVEPGVKPLLTTEEASSTPVIGWTTNYGKARVVTLQGGHDVPTYENPDYRKILRQAVEWVFNEGK